MAQFDVNAGNGISEGEGLERASVRPGETERPSRRYSGGRGIQDRDRALKRFREIEFPVAMRGYERAAVDRYVTEVNRAIAELEISSSPEAAVQHALDDVSEETRELLQRAYQTAEEITAKSRSKADDRLQQAEREAEGIRAAAVTEAEQTREVVARETQQLREVTAREVSDMRETAQRESSEMRETAQREVAELRETTVREVAELRESAAREAEQLRASAQREADELRSSARREAEERREAVELHARELARSAEKVWRERRRLLEDMRAVADELAAIGDTEAARFTRFDPDGLVVDSEAATEAAGQEVARPPTTQSG
jgi:DivIVA domain-containing protein